MIKPMRFTNISSMILHQRTFTSKIIFPDKSLMTSALMISKISHSLSDRNDKLNRLLEKEGKNNLFSTNSYHKHFIGGINPYYKQTNNCLIIEGYYGMPISQIHTPLGYWSIAGSSMSYSHKNSTESFISSDTILKQELFENIKCDMLCPGYQTEMGFYGPYWLVKSINKIPVEYPNIDLLPESPNLDLTKWNNIKCDAEVLENKKKLKQYLKQLNKLYKNNYNYGIGKDIFEELLQEWIKSSYISDIHELSKQMIRSDDAFESFKHIFLNKINVNSHKFVLSGSKIDIIFKLIYYAKLNDNSIQHINKM
jgi:hypothetical protein